MPLDHGPSINFGRIKKSLMSSNGRLYAKYWKKKLVPALVLIVSSVLAWRIGELEITLWLNTHRCSQLDEFFEHFTNLGDYVVSTGMFLIVIFPGRKASKYKYPALLGLLGWIILDLVFTSLVLKPLVHRERPYSLDSRIKPIGWPTKDYSFPSGHTVTAFSFTTPWFLQAASPLVRSGLLLFACLMGFSRVYCGVHFPTDVFVGALIGI